MDSIYNSLRAWAEVDLDAVHENHKMMKRFLPEGVKCAAVIKATEQDVSQDFWRVRLTISPLL